MLIICIGIMAATAEWVGDLLTDAYDEIFMQSKACRKYRVRERSGWHRRGVSAPQIMCHAVTLLSVYWKVVWFNSAAYRFLRCRWNCGSDLLYPLHVSPFLPHANTAKHIGQSRGD